MQAASEKPEGSPRNSKSGKGPKPFADVGHQKLTRGQVVGALAALAAFLAWKIAGVLRNGESAGAPPANVPESRPPFTGETGYLKGDGGGAAYADTENDFAEFMECYGAGDAACIKKMVYATRIRITPDGTRIRVVETDFSRRVLRVRILDGPGEQSVVWTSMDWARRGR